MADLLTRMGPDAASSESAQVWKVTSEGKKEPFDLVGRVSSGKTVFAGNYFINVKVPSMNDYGRLKILAESQAIDKAKQFGYDYAMLNGFEDFTTFGVNFYVDKKSG